MSKLELQAEQCRFLQTAIISHVVLKPTNKTKLKMYSAIFTSIISYHQNWKEPTTVQY